jgi:hypothetical protein
VTDLAPLFEPIRLGHVDVRNRVDAEHVLTVFDVLEHGAAVGRKALVVDDGEGGWKGIGLALHLADAGHEVHLSTPLPHVGAAIGPFSQNRLIPRIFEAGIVTHPFALVTAVRGDEVELRKQGRPFVLTGVDTVILDAVASRSMLEAIHEGERAARRV